MSIATLGWAESWRIARRDLTAGFRGLRLLLVCLFLGVATLATIGSLTASITQEMAARGQVLLGGDVEVSMTQRQASEQERTALASHGKISDTIRTRAMARRDTPADGAPDAVLSEIKGVDARYPLYGTLSLSQGAYHPLTPDEVVIDRSLSERLLLQPGDSVRYGEATFRIIGIIADEPDRVGEGFTLGPVAIVSLEGIARTGLLAPGALYETKYRIRLAPQTDPETVIKQLEDQFGAQSWEYKHRDRAAPGAVRFFERMGQFLALIGLAALVIAGIGVSNGVSSYLSLKRSSIATLKILGATSADIARIYLLEIGTVALVGVGAGLVTGALLPLALVTLTKDVLPVAPSFALHPLPLLTSALYGLLIAFAFALPPLARARSQPAAAQFRGGVETAARLDRRTILSVAAALGAGCRTGTCYGARTAVRSRGSGRSSRCFANLAWHWRSNPSHCHTASPASPSTLAPSFGELAPPRRANSGARYRFGPCPHPLCHTRGDSDQPQHRNPTRRTGPRA